MSKNVCTNWSTWARAPVSLDAKGSSGVLHYIAGVADIWISSLSNDERLLFKVQTNYLFVNLKPRIVSFNTSKMESKEELRKRLTPLQYQVTQEAATEKAFTGEYSKFYEKGLYRCIVCHQDLFSSDTKYDSGCGWPAFNDVLEQEKITLHKDTSITDRVRTEVRCAKCDAHMGHVFGKPITSLNLNCIFQIR